MARTTVLTAVTVLRERPCSLKMVILSVMAAAAGLDEIGCADDSFDSDVEDGDVGRGWWRCTGTAVLKDVDGRDCGGRR